MLLGLHQCGYREPQTLGQRRESFGVHLVHQTADTAKIERYIRYRLGQQDDVFTERMRESDLVEDVWVPVRQVGD